MNEEHLKIEYRKEFADFEIFQFHNLVNGTKAESTCIAARFFLSVSISTDIFLIDGVQVQV